MALLLATYPGSQSHVKLPKVLVHSPYTPQSIDMHSSTSTIKKRKKLKYWYKFYKRHTKGDIVLRQYVNDVREVRRNFVPRLHSSLPHEREWTPFRTHHVTARSSQPLKRHGNWVGSTFAKTSGICYWRQALADRRVPSNEPRKHCGTNFFRLQFPPVVNWNSTFDKSDNFSVSHKVDSGKISVRTFLFRLQTQPTSSQLCVNGTWKIAAINIHLVIWLEVKMRSQRNLFSFSVARVYLCIFYHPQYIQFCIHICNCPVCWYIFLQSSNTVSCCHQHIRRYLFKDVKSR